MTTESNEKEQNLAGQWCGQTQPHGPHRWAPSMYQSTSTFWRECAGHLSIRVANDPPLACSCGNPFDGDNLCMVSACQWEGVTDNPPGVARALDANTPSDHESGH